MFHVEHLTCHHQSRAVNPHATGLKPGFDLKIALHDVLMEVIFHHAAGFLTSCPVKGIVITAAAKLDSIHHCSMLNYIVKSIGCLVNDVLPFHGLAIQALKHTANLAI